MREVFLKFRHAISHNYKVTVAVPEWSIVMVVLGVAITPVWAGVLLWFLVHFITQQWLLLH